jgi:hypothetical protein
MRLVVIPRSCRLNLTLRINRALAHGTPVQPRRRCKRRKERRKSVAPPTTLGRCRAAPAICVAPPRPNRARALRSGIALPGQVGPLPECSRGIRDKSALCPRFAGFTARGGGAVIAPCERGVNARMPHDPDIGERACWGFDAVCQNLDNDGHPARAAESSSIALRPHPPMAGSTSATPQGESGRQPDWSNGEWRLWAYSR